MAEVNSIKCELTHPEARLPTRGTPGSAGFDLYSYGEYELKANSNIIIGTGVIIEPPTGYFGLIHPRSSFMGRGINTGAGVIDNDYRGEIKVVLFNLTNESVIITRGMRFAQIVFYKYFEGNMEIGSVNSESLRGAGGFGSTG